MIVDKNYYSFTNKCDHPFHLQTMFLFTEEWIKKTLAETLKADDWWADDSYKEKGWKVFFMWFRKITKCTSKWWEQFIAKTEYISCKNRQATIYKRISNLRLHLIHQAIYLCVLFAHSDSSFPFIGSIDKNCDFQLCGGWWMIKKKTIEKSSLFTLLQFYQTIDSISFGNSMRTVKLLHTVEWMALNNDYRFYYDCSKYEHSRFSTFDIYFVDCWHATHFSRIVNT